MRRLIISRMFIYLFLVTGFIFAQDTHYWNNQYGTDAQLLGGVVVGDISDLSAVYYNPGAIALTKGQRLVLTTSGFEGTYINIINDRIEDQNINYWSFSPVPGIFAARFMGENENDWHLVFSFLTRHDFRFNLRSGINTPYMDQLPPGESYVSGEIFTVAELFEGWGGFTLSKAVNENLGIGVTQFVAYRGQNKRFQFSGNTMNEQSNESELIVNHFDYYNVRTFWKFGILYDLKKITLGLNITTPSLNIFGFGDTYIHSSQTGTDLVPDSTNKFQYSVDQQSDVSSLYKSPLAISIGLSWKFEDTKIHFSAEWFNDINEYKVMAPDDFRSQSSGETISYSYHSESESVINYGIAITYRLSNKTSLFGGFITDFSANPNDFSDNISISSWDIYHLNMGSSFVIFDFALTTGLNFGFGDQKINSNLNTEDDFLPGGVQFEARYFSVKIFLGLSI